MRLAMCVCEFYLVVLVCKLGGSGWGGMEHMGGKEGKKLACRLMRKGRRRRKLNGRSTELGYGKE